MEYFIKASTVLGIFYICYKLFLQKETFFNANRWFLLAGLLVALILPLVVIPIYVEYTAIALPRNLATENHINEISNTQISFVQIMTWIYAVGVIFFFGKLGIEFASLFSLLKNNYRKTTDRFTFIETTEPVSPFSFFNWIVYNPNQYQEQELTHILNHEKVHAKQYHSIDIIISQISCVLFWFNPFCWLYKKELQQNLEFIADYEAQNLSNCEKSYQRLLVKTSIPNHQLLVTNNFYNSLIKKRIVMLHKSKSNKLKAWKYALILPLLALFLMSFNTKEVYINSKPSKDFQINNLTEKEVVIITKDMSDAQLEKIKNQLLAEGLIIKFKKVKRNASKEIIAIKIDVKSEVSSANYYVSNNEPITPISISYDKGGKQIAIGNTSLNSNMHEMIFISDDGGISEIDTENDDENIVIYKTKDDIEKEVELDMRQGENVMFISDDVNVKTLKEGNKTIEIITISDDEDVIEIENDGSPTSKKIWVTKADSDVNWTTNENGNKEQTYKVKIITSDANDDPLKLTTEGSEMNQNIKILKLKEKDGVFISSDNGTPLYFLDGKEISEEEMTQINPNIIANVEVYKGDMAIKKYGDKGKDGVIEITTKK